MLSNESTIVSLAERMETPARRDPRRCADLSHPDFQAWRERYPDVEQMILTVTPELAAEWIGFNTQNRQLRGRRTTYYAGKLARGEWRLSPDMIAFDTNGVVLNGQHRLHAIIEADVPMDCAVIFNLPRETFALIDRPLTRRVSDALSALGATNSHSLASTLAALWTFMEYGRFRDQGIPPSEGQIISLYDRTAGDIHEAVAMTDKVRRGIGSGTAPIGALAYIFARIDADDAQAFFERVADGVGLAEDDPRYRLRKRLLESRSQAHKLTPDMLGALTIKAWNAFQDGRTMNGLVWKSGGKTPEAYPVVDGWVEELYP